MNKVGLALICWFLGVLVDFIMILCGKFTRKDGSLVDK